MEQTVRLSSHLEQNIVLCTRMLKLYPESSANPYLSWAFQLLKQKQYKKAKQKFQKSIQLSPNPLSFYNCWLEALYAARQFEDVILFVEKNPDKFSIPYNIDNTVGICYLHLGDYENAVKCFEKVIKIKEDFYLIYWNWALALYLQGKKEEALEMMGRNENIRELYVTVYQREIVALKEELKGEDGKGFEELILRKIEGFEYILKFMQKKMEEVRRR